MEDYLRDPFRGTCKAIKTLYTLCVSRFVVFLLAFESKLSMLAEKQQTPSFR
jgi:hypothetical protein